MKKRLIAKITIACLLVSLLSGMVFSVGAADTPVYVRDMTTASEQGTYYVESEADLNQLAELVNGGMMMYGYTFLQTKDITLTSDNFTPIGYYTSSTVYSRFRGTYDGQRHTISNLQIYDETRNGAGLFGYAYKAKLRNIGIESGSVTAANRAGGITGYGDGCIIQNCYNKADITILSGTDGVGGISGVCRSSAEIYGCFNLGTITCNTSAAGGICGWGGSGDNITVHGCYSAGTIQNTGTLASSASIDVISRFSERNYGDFSTSYYLAGIYGEETDDYNHLYANKLETADNLKMAYVMNHAKGGVNTNAFTVDASGNLVFSADESEGVIDLRLKVWKDGVLQEDTGFSRVTKGGYTVPTKYNSTTVLNAEAGGITYEVGALVPADSIGELIVNLYLKGDYPSISEYASNTTATAFTVSTAAELATLAELVDAGNTFEGKSIYVTADLDFAGYNSWNPIGEIASSGGGDPDENAKPFSGTFDGQYHHFKNINFRNTESFVALFAYTNGATLRNMILDEGTIYSTGRMIGVLAGFTYSSTVSNIENHVAVQSGYPVAETTALNMGLVARSSMGSAFSNIVNYGEVMGVTGVAAEEENGSIVGWGYSNTKTTLNNVIAIGAVGGTNSHPIARGCTVTKGYYLSTHEAEGTMTWEELLGGKAAWMLNQNVDPDVWSVSADGPVLDPDHPAYRMTYPVNEANDMLSGTTVKYHNRGETVKLPAVDGFTLLNAAKKIWPLTSKFTMPGADGSFPLYYDRTAYSINYVLNGGKFISESIVSTITGVAEELPGPNDVLRDGYGLVGWYDNEELTGTPVTETSVSAYHDVTYYAKWAVLEEISTAAQLKAIKMDGHYVMTKNIDLSGVSFTPLGTYDAPFTGSFDGNGYTISGLTINSTGNYQGLFGVNKGLIYNLTLADDCTISGNAHVGGIAGSNIGNIFNCISRATVKVNASSTKESTIKVMVQNLKVSPNADRKKYMRQRIDANDPDLLILQEANTPWITELNNYYNYSGSSIMAGIYGYTDEYDMLYKYRYEAGDTTDAQHEAFVALGYGYESESTPIMYKTDKFTLVEYDHFWLTETPDVASVPYEEGAKHFRIGTMVVLQDKTSGQKIAVFSVHLDNSNNVVRAINAQAIRDKIDAIEAKYDGIMVITAGDLNCQQGSKPYNTIMGEELENVLDLQTDSTITRRIDHIFVTPDNTKVVNGTFKYLSAEYPVEPSDHKGLYVELQNLSGDYFGGIAGSNMGLVSNCVADGAVSGGTEYGSLIGMNLGETDALYYAEQTSVPALGLSVATEAISVMESDLAAVYGLNHSSEDPVFTVDTAGNVAINSHGEDPACVTTDGTTYTKNSSHSYGTATTVAPTCTEVGYTGQTCANCGYEKKTNEVAALGHTWGAWKKYSSGLYHKRTCKTDAEHVEFESHTFSSSEYHTASCGTYGYTRTSCDCGYYYDVIDNAKLSHIWGDYQEADAQNHQQLCARNAEHSLVTAHTLTETPVAATCEVGCGTQYDCATCGYSHFEETGEPLGHAYSDFKKVDENVHQKICANDKSHIITDAHQMSTEVVEPNCEDAGYTRHTCADCDYYYDTDPVAAFGHEYAYDAEKQQYVCHCGDVYEQEFDLNGDGSADAKDAIMLLRYIDNHDVEIALRAADANNDGVVTIYDAVRFLQLLIA